MLNETSGFTFAGNVFNPETKIYSNGLQIIFDNNYTISIMSSKLSNSPHFMYDTVAISIFKEEGIPCTIDIMEKMSYSPTYAEMKINMFLNISPYMLAKILYYTSMVDVQ